MGISAALTTLVHRDLFGSLSSDSDVQDASLGEINQEAAAMGT